MATRSDGDSSTYGTAVALRSNQLELNPIVRAGAVAAKERESIIHIEDYNVNISIIVVVSKSTPPTGKTLVNTWPQTLRYIVELAVPQVA
jgi:hypothetical protein